MAEGSQAHGRDAGRRFVTGACGRGVRVSVDVVRVIGLLLRAFQILVRL